MANQMPKGEWPLQTGGPGTVTRGACVECKDEATASQELLSVCFNGTSLCVCERCGAKPKYAKHMSMPNA